MTSQKPENLTALRAFYLLLLVERDRQAPTKWTMDQVVDALRNHVLAALKRKRRRPR